MQKCNQNDTQSVYQHGLSVKDHIFNLIVFLETEKISGNWKLPDWLIKYRLQIFNAIYPMNIIEEYAIYHDCSKPYCIQYDENGKKHFPNHAERSYEIWLEAGGDKEAALLMKMDMDIHLLKSSGIEEFCKRPQAITLLISGLSEIHANSSMFGGIDSISFKIKYKQIYKRGAAICNILFA